MAKNRSKKQTSFKRPFIAPVNTPPPKPKQPFMNFLTKVPFLFIGIALISMIFGFWTTKTKSPVSLSVSSFTTSITNSTTMVELVYFLVVTLSTVGYGDYKPFPTHKTMKVFLAFWILFSTLAFAYFLGHISELLTFVEEKVAGLLSDSFVDPHNNKKLTNRYKTMISFTVITLFIGLGVSLGKRCEGLDFIDSLYFSVISVTSVGYGDVVVKKPACQLGAIFWLFNSTIFVGMAFSFIGQVSFVKRAEYKVDLVLDRTFEMAVLKEALEMVDKDKRS